MVSFHPASGRRWSRTYSTARRFEALSTPTRSRVRAYSMVYRTSHARRSPIEMSAAQWSPLRVGLSRTYDRASRTAAATAASDGEAFVRLLASASDGEAFVRSRADGPAATSEAGGASADAPPAPAAVRAGATLPATRS